MEKTMNNTAAVDRASVKAIRPNEALAIDVERGAAIRCVGGKVWLTQEGDARDYVVPAGTTFCTDRAGRIVATALDTTSAVIVCKAQAHCMPGTVTIDSVERFTSAAKAAQCAYMAELFGTFARWVKRSVRRTTSRPLRPGRAEEKFHGFVRSL
jgi:hypothetical protein